MSRRRSSPHSVNDVLNRARTLRQLSGTIPQQQEWAEWLRGRLPGELAAHLVSVVRRGPPAARAALAARLGAAAQPGTTRPATTQPAAAQLRAAQLIVFADSAAWCTRLRYAVSALTTDIHARDGAIGRIQVRVLMNTAG